MQKTHDLACLQRIKGYECIDFIEKIRNIHFVAFLGFRYEYICSIIIYEENFWE